MPRACSTIAWAVSSSFAAASGSPAWSAATVPAWAAVRLRERLIRIAAVLVEPQALRPVLGHLPLQPLERRGDLLRVLEQPRDPLHAATRASPRERTASSAARAPIGSAVMSSRAWSVSAAMAASSSW